MSNSNVSTDSATLTLATLNTFGVPFARKTRARLATVARELNHPTLDVVCLQEVQMARYVPLLTQAFTHFPFAAFEPFIYAPKGGLMTLSRRQFEQTDFLLYRERGWWHTLSIADWMLHKGALLTRMTVFGTPVIVINTHLIANYDGDWSHDNRYAQIEATELRQLAGLVNRQDPAALIVVAGDFNFPRRSWLYHEFVEAIGAEDPLSDHTAPTFRPPFLLDPSLAEAIDHVFIRPPRGVLIGHTAELLFEHKVRLVGGRRAYVSDHLGISVTLQWPRQHPDSHTYSHHASKGFDGPRAG